jgi:hypothetical protein
MALRRENNISPEENLLRLIEKPAGVGETPFQDGDLTIVLGKQKGVSPKVIINWLLAFPVIILGLGKGISLKTVNRFCLVMITVLLGYAVWGAVSAETPVIKEPDIRKSNVDDMTEQPDISNYHSEVDKRDIFMDMYKPPVVEPVKISPVVSPVIVPPTVAEAKLAMAEVVKNLKLVGIIWDPQSVASGLVLIDNGSDVLCLARGDTLKTNVEQSGAMRNINIEIKEISKDKVTLRYENEEEMLMLTDK